MKKLFLLLVALECLLGAAGANIAVVGSLARRSTVKPGDAMAGVIFLKNSGTTTAEARVSQVDYRFQADGSNDFGQAGQTPRSNAGWFTVTPSRIKLAPGETIPVRYQGRVPSDAGLRGTYWSVVMVEPNAAPPIAPDGKSTQIAVGLQTMVRFAVQIITDVGQTGTRSLHVVDKRLANADGKRSLEIDVTNDGERLLVPQTTVELFDGQGNSIGRFDAGRASIFPACSIRAKVNLTDVPEGAYTAMVLLDSGDAQVFGAQYKLKIATAEAQLGEPASRHAGPTAP